LRDERAEGAAMSDRENFRKFRSGIALRVLIAIAAAVAVASPSLRAQPVLFHEHGHGLSFSSGAKALLAPSRPGGGVPVVSADAPVESVMGRGN
jgi:hypothetical protein